MKPQPTMRVPIVTSVSGGRGVPSDETDWEITGFREVSIVDGADSAATFFITTVDGPSLEAEHIVDGDWLLCRVTRVGGGCDESAFDYRGYSCPVAGTGSDKAWAL